MLLVPDNEYNVSWAVLLLDAGIMSGSTAVSLLQMSCQIGLF